MGYIPSMSAVTATAYLTEIGRNYLFNKTNNRFDSSGDDLFEITKFALSDGDTNYLLDQNTYKLSSGEVPDITGEGSGDCLKTTANYTQRNLISYMFDDSPNGVEYSTDLNNNALLISEGSIPSTTEIPPPIIGIKIPEKTLI